MYSLKLFGNKIAPACAYCSFGFPAGDGEMLLCSKRGIVPPGYACRHYQYDPIMRVPQPPLQFEQYDEDQFQL